MGDAAAPKTLRALILKRLYAIVALVVLGAVLKSIGVLAGSKAAFVDMLTCVASVAAAVLAVRASALTRVSRRFEVAGILWVTVIYAIVAGYALAVLMMSSPAHRVEEKAVLYVAAGTAVYAAAIWLSMGAGLAGRAYALFSMSEVYEGLVTLASVAAGSLWNPLYDYLGAWLLLAYVYYELYEHVKQLTEILVERAPEELARRIADTLKSLGLEPVRIEARPVLPGEYAAVITVRVKERDFERAHRLVDEAERLLKKRLNVVATIHYEPG